MYSIEPQAKDNQPLPPPSTEASPYLQHTEAYERMLALRERNEQLTILLQEVTRISES